LQPLACHASLSPLLLLQVHPEFRQAGSLLEVCDKEVLKDGIVGLGAGAAILGAVAAIAVAAMRK
jgi:hypothetical protein